MPLLLRLPLGRLLIVMVLAATVLIGGALVAWPRDRVETAAAVASFEASLFRQLPEFDRVSGRRIEPSQGSARGQVSVAAPAVAPAPEPTAAPAPAVTVCGSRESVATLFEPGAIVRTGVTTTNRIALTFDMDEGQVGVLPAILTALRDHQAKATFFVTGSWAKHNPDWLRAIVAEGHELANHSYNHPDFTRLSAERIIDELESTDHIVTEITGLSTRPYFRPPYAAQNPSVNAVLAEQGYLNVLWDVDPQDWRGRSATYLTQHILTEAVPGRIIILHGYPRGTGEAMPGILAGLRERGLEPATLSQVIHPPCDGA